MKAPLITMNDGHQIPAIGLGTYQIRGGAGLDQVLTAIQDGYRLLDTSTNYDSEGIVGEAIRRSGIPRSEFFVTTKLPGKYHHYEDALMMIQESLFRMGLDYFDLYLIHWPLPKRGLYVEAWQALVTAQKLGLIRSIGVSNFEPEHLDKIIEETGVSPAINQIELHPYWVQERMVKANEERGIIPIPKSRNLLHQRENLDIYDFELTQTEIERINLLEKADGRIEGQDPNEYEEFD